MKYRFTMQPFPKFKQHLLCLLLTCSCSCFILAQSVGVGTSTPDASAMFDITSANKGLLIPRMSLTDRQSIVDPAIGLMVFDSTAKAFYYYTGSGWLELLAGSVDRIMDADGDTGIEVEQSPDEDVIRMSLAGLESLIISRTDSGRTQIEIPNNNNNMFFGTDAGQGAATTAQNNIAIGRSSQFGLSTGSYNTSVGYEALRGVAMGEQNAAVGYRTMLNANGSLNAALGASALQSVSGVGNIGVGYLALAGLDLGSDNVAVGRAALRNNISGSGNVALGTLAGTNETGSNTLYIANSNADSAHALIYGEFDNNWLVVNGHFTPTEGLADADGDTRLHVDESPDDDILRFDIAGVEYFRMDSGRLEFVNTGNSVFVGQFAGAADDFTDNRNAGIGTRALGMNTSGRWNSALGYSAMDRNTTGQQNVAIGFASAYNNQTGNQNIAIGTYAQYDGQGDRSIAIGTYAGRYSGSGNVFLGDSVGYYESGDNRLYIDNSPADSAHALLYGRFDADLLQINGTAKVNGKAYVTDRLGVGIANPGEKFMVYPNSFTNGVIGYARIETCCQNLLSDGIVSFSHNHANFPAIQQYGDGATWVGTELNKGLFFNVEGEDYGSLRDGNLVSGPLRGWDFYYPADGLYVMKITNQSTSDEGADPYNGLSVKAGRNVNNGANSSMIGFFRPDGTEIGKVVQNNSNSVSYSTSSDIRLKTNIQPTHFSIEDLMQIDVRDYVYRDEPNDPQVGFIAQQLYEHYPLAVTPGGDDARTNPWMVDYSKLTPLIVKAVQDQQQQIELLKEQNALLMQQIELLRQ